MSLFYSAVEGAATLAQRCDKARLYGDSWQACCPAHEDRTPSLSITPQDDRILLHCHAGCETREVVAALGYELRDLYITPEPLPPYRPPRRPRPAAARPAAPPAGETARPKPPPAASSPAAGPPAPDAGPPRVVATYDYVEAHGTLLFQVRRFEPGFHGRAKDFRQYRPDGQGGWIANLKGVTRVLYHLPAVQAGIAAGELIYLPEGEKDARNLIALGLIATTNAGGAAKWEPPYTETLRGAHVVILQDHDTSGQQHTARLTRELHGVAASLKVVTFPELPAKGDVSDWLDLGHTGDELAARVAATPLWEPAAQDAAEAPQAEERPRIRLSADLPGMVDALEQILEAEVPPRLYVHLDRLCVLRRHQGGTAPGRLPTTGGMYMADLTRAHLTELASTVARWETYDGRRKAWRHTLPHDKALDAFLARGQWPFPALSGVITAPTLRPDGSVLEQPGYDAATGLYYDPHGVPFPPVPVDPDIFDTRIAIEALREVFVDFLYADPASFATVLAALLSLVGRPTIQGNVPLFGVTATTRGSGKSLLVDTLALLATGTRAPKWSPTRDEEEERKQLLTLALSGAALVCIDNCAAPLGSPPLALVLTAGVVQGRLLGTNTLATVPVQTVFFATGNNLQYRGDLARRVVPIHLDPQMERPEERRGFRHPQLLQWVAAERPRLLIAALTVLRAYGQASSPPQDLTPYGSFEAWSDTVRSAVVWAGEADPCCGRQDLEAASSPEHETHAALLAAWQDCYHGQAVTLKKVIADTLVSRSGPAAPPNTWETLHDALADADVRFDGKTLHAKRIGNVLRTWQGRYIQGLRFLPNGKDRKGSTEWRLEGIPRS